MVACVGDERMKDRTRFETVDGVEKVVPILAPYKMASAEVKKERTIVNIDRIKELQPMFYGEYTVTLQNGTRLTLSRRYRDKLQQLGLG